MDDLRVFVPYIEAPGDTCIKKKMYGRMRLGTGAPRSSE